MDAAIVDAVNVTNYIIGDVRMTWSDAETYCQLQGTNLASVHSTQDRDNAKSLCMTRPATDGHDGCWIGLHQPAGGEAWEWSDGSDLNYGFSGDEPTTGVDPWDHDQPNNWHEEQDCAQLDQQYAFNWGANRCPHNYYPVCNGLYVAHYMCSHSIIRIALRQRCRRLRRTCAPLAASAA